MKNFFIENWSVRDITDYLNDHGVLVLFSSNSAFYGVEASMIVYGRRMSEIGKENLKKSIIDVFGGQEIDAELGTLINDHAEKWYNLNVLKKKARVVNLKRK